MILLGYADAENVGEKRTSVKKRKVMGGFRKKKKDDDVVLFMSQEILETSLF